MYFKSLDMSLRITFIIFCMLGFCEKGISQFKVRDQNNNVIPPHVLNQKVIEHLFGIKDNSNGKNGATFFGLSKINATIVPSVSVCIGPVCGSINYIKGTFETAGKSYPVNLETIEVAGSSGAVSGGISVNTASVFNGAELDFVTLRISGSTDVRTVLKSISKKVPGLGQLAEKSGVIDKVADVVDPVLGKLKAGGTVRFDILPQTSSNNFLSFRLATQFDVVAADGVNFEGRKFKGGGGVAGVKTVGGQFQFSWPHIEALTNFRFSDDIRLFFDDSYSPLHNNFFDPSSSIIYDYGPNAETSSTFAVLGTGLLGTAISGTSSLLQNDISGYQVQALGSLNSRRLTSSPTSIDLDALFDGKNPPTSSAIGIAPFNSIGGTFTEGQDRVVTTAALNSDAIVTYRNAKPVDAIPLLDNYQGVDFTNLKVVGLDVDQTTKAVNFIIRGTRKNSGNASNLNAESKLLKTVFIEALSIPNNAQFVSLETNPPRAEAYEPFKHTRMGQIFFVADEKMKKDFARKVYVNSGGTNIVQAWYNRLENVQTPRNFLKKLFDRGVVPGIEFHIRANIIPVIPNGNKDGSKVFIQDAKYSIKVLDAYTTLVLRNINGGNVAIGNNLPPNTVGITNGEFNILLDQLNPFNDFFVQKTLQGRNQIINDVNNGVGSYKNLKRILPAIVAAHWYKQSNLAEGSLKDIINTGDLSAQYTGYNLSRPFNQGLWDSKASQLLATLNSSAAGYTIESDITGGITINNNVNPSKLTTNLKAVQKVIFDQSLTDGYNANNYANSGGITYNIAELVPSGIVALPNTKNLAGYGLSYIENRPTRITIGVSNNGNKRATNVLLRWYAKKGNGPTNLIGSKRISSVEPYTTETHSFLYNPGKLSGVLLTQPIKISYTVNEDERTSELSYSNNKMDQELLYGYIINDAEVTEKAYSWALGASSDYLFSANEYARLGDKTVVNSNAKLSMHATTRVVLEPGFKAKNGSKFRAWIGTDVEAINEYNRLNPVSSSASGKNGSASEIDGKNHLEPLVINKVQRLPINAKLDALRSRNLEDNGFTKPYILNYKVIDQPEANNLSEDNTMFRALYPNPTTGETEVELFLNTDSNIVFELFTSNGNRIKTIKTIPKVQQGFSTIPLNLSDVPEGVYIIMLTSKEGQESKLILKK